MLRILMKLIALLFLALALITAILDITRSIADSTIIITPLGLDWFNFSPGSLNLSQAIVQRYVHPYIWDPVVQTILQAPSWVVFGAIWFLISIATRRRRRRLRNRYQ